MKRSPDNQINASFIDISRIKWLVLLLWSSFFRTTRPLASSEATTYYRPAPGRTDGIPERDQRPRDNGYKSVFTNSWLVCLGWYYVFLPNCFRVTGYSNIRVSGFRNNPKRTDLKQFFTNFNRVNFRGMAKGWSIIHDWLVNLKSYMYI